MQHTVQRVCELYRNPKYNCARIMLTCLGESFGTPADPQSLQAAGRMDGSGNFHAPCGLAAGALLFIGLMGPRSGKNAEDVEKLYYRFTEAFTARFGSLLCRDLRPGGFRPSDPSHVCGDLIIDAVNFTEDFLKHSDMLPTQG